MMVAFFVLGYKVIMGYNYSNSTRSLIRRIGCQKLRTLPLPEHLFFQYYEDELQIRWPNGSNSANDTVVFLLKHWTVLNWWVGRAERVMNFPTDLTSPHRTVWCFGYGEPFQIQPVSGKVSAFNQIRGATELGPSGPLGARDYEGPWESLDEWKSGYTNKPPRRFLGSGSKIAGPDELMIF
jgi:hypothetical protein